VYEVTDHSDAHPAAGSPRTALLIISCLDGYERNGVNLLGCSPGARASAVLRLGRALHLHRRTRGGSVFQDHKTRRSGASSPGCARAGLAHGSAEARRAQEASYVAAASSKYVEDAHGVAGCTSATAVRRQRTAARPGRIEGFEARAPDRDVLPIGLPDATQDSSASRSRNQATLWREARAPASAAQCTSVFYSSKDGHRVRCTSRIGATMVKDGISVALLGYGGFRRSSQPANRRRCRRGSRWAARTPRRTCRAAESTDDWHRGGRWQQAACVR